MTKIFCHFQLWEISSEAHLGLQLDKQGKSKAHVLLQIAEGIPQEPARECNQRNRRSRSCLFQYKAYEYIQRKPTMQHKKRDSTRYLSIHVNMAKAYGTSAIVRWSISKCSLVNQQTFAGLSANVRWSISDCAGHISTTADGHGEITWSVGNRRDVFSAFPS